MKKLWAIKESKKGFTLVELIVVLVILAILAAIMIPSLTGWINKAKEKEVVLSARNSYLAAQGLVFESYAVNDEIPGIDDIRAEDIQSLTNDEAGISVVRTIGANGVITEFEYTIDQYKATYRDQTWTIITEKGDK